MTPKQHLFVKNRTSTILYGFFIFNLVLTLFNIEKYDSKEGTSSETMSKYFGKEMIMKRKLFFAATLLFCFFTLSISILAAETKSEKCTLEAMQLLPVTQSSSLAFSANHPNSAIDNTEDSASIDVTMSVIINRQFAQTKENGIMQEKTVHVQDKNKDGKYTLNEAILCAHEQYYTNGSDGYSSSENSETGIVSLTKLWGETENIGKVWVNHKTAGSLSATEIKNNDFIMTYTSYINAVKEDASWSDRYTKFNIPMGHDLYVNVPTTLKITALKENNVSQSGLNYTVSVDGDPNNYTLIMGKNNAGTITFSKAGTYTILATPTDLMGGTPASNTITVKPVPTSLKSLDFYSDAAATQKLEISPSLTPDVHDYTISNLYDGASKAYFKANGDDGYMLYFGQERMPGMITHSGVPFNGIYSFTTNTKQTLNLIAASDYTTSVNSYTEIPCNYYNLNFRYTPSLKNLTINETLSPAFDSKVNEYTVYADPSSDTIKLSITPTNKAYQIKVNDKDVSEGGTIELPVTWDSKQTFSINVKVTYPENSNYDENTYRVIVHKMEQGETPKIYIQPKSAEYYVGDNVSPLNFTATAGGTMSYQWYRSEDENITSGVAIKDAIEATYLPSTAEPSDFYYYCRITNTASGKSSSTSPVKVTVKANPTPKITLLTPGTTIEAKEGYHHPVPTGFVCDANADAPTFKISAISEGVGGKLSYQWYSAKTADETGSKIKKATKDSYSPKVNAPTKQNGDCFYYCKVTYTDTAGRKFVADSDRIYLYVYVTEATAATEDLIMEQPFALESYDISETATIYPILKSGANVDVLTYQWYRCNEESYENAVAVEGATEQQFKPNKTLGTSYYFCEIRNSVQNTTATVKTDIVAITYTDASKELAAEKFEGSGTKEEPFLLNTLEDLKSLSALVDLGHPMYGLTFKITDNITTDGSFSGIGNKEFFGGEINGSGYTITYEEGSQTPLLGKVRQAKVYNLKIMAPYIKNYALVSGYTIDEYSTTEFNTVTIDHVTLLSGSKVRNGGFIGGIASGSNCITLSNCTIEENVQIGCNADGTSAELDYIGSLAGWFNGKVINCASAATVYGKNYVGGLIGGKNQTMGSCSILNSSFTGKVIASGNYVGGIIGCGYSGGPAYGIETAPNTPCVSIQNCYVNGSITGANYIGGLQGGEIACTQCWENGIGYIRDNYFYGNLTATEENGVKGGLIGFMKSLDRYNIISNNYYKTTNEIVPTFGFVDKNFVDRSSGKYGRNDDPLGKDADLLGMTVTENDLKNGSVTKQLNNSESSLKNWIQKNELPTHSDTPIAYALKISETYKTEYYIGDTLDLSGIKITAMLSDGTVKTLQPEDLSVTGFDSSTRGIKTLTLSYGAAKTQITVTVLKKPQGDHNITVYFTLLGDKIHEYDTDGDLHTRATDNLEVWIKRTACTVDANALVKDVVEQILERNNMSCINVSGNYISGITKDGVTLSEFDNGMKSGWMYTLNGVHPQLGVAQQFLEDGDEIIFHYTDNYMAEESLDQVICKINALNEITLDSKETLENARKSYDALEDLKSSLPKKYTEKLEEAENTYEKLVADAKNHEEIKAVEDAIDAIGEVTRSSIDIIHAARRAYDNLSPEQQSKVKNADILIAAEKDIEKLYRIMPFTDVQQDDYFYNAILWAVNSGIAKGISETTFAPDMTCTRSQMITFLYRAAGSPEVRKTDCKFRDIPPDTYYYNAVCWAAENNITNGISQTEFAPDSNVTRNQVITLLYRYTGSPDVNNEMPFIDVPYDVYYYNAVLWAVSHSITNGVSESHFAPEQNCTRGQIVTFLHRAQ